IARVEGVRAAEIERARIEARERARADQLSAERAHEQRLAAIGAGRARTGLRRSSWIVAASSCALVAAIAFVYFSQIKPAADERTRGLEAMIAERRAQNDQMQHALDAQHERVRELEDRVKSEQDAA